MLNVVCFSFEYEQNTGEKKEKGSLYMFACVRQKEGEEKRAVWTVIYLISAKIK